MRVLLLCTAICFAWAELYSVVMTADPGGFSGVAENKYIKQEMVGIQDVSEQLLYCAEAFTGTLFATPTLLVTTGIGHDNATMCMLNVLQVFHSPPQNSLREVVFLGTSGWSPRPGGVLTAPVCSAQGPDISLLGDVCISAATTNWDCQLCNWAPPSSSNVCQFPPCSGHFGETHYNGGCNFVGDTVLAAEVISAAGSAQLPEMDSVLQDFVGRYWAQMSTGTGVQYQVRSTPQLFDFRQCAEAGSYTFWSGLPYEMQCRDYVAAITSGEKLPTICVAAMEAPGWISVLLRNRKISVPFVNIRGASDYAHAPLNHNNGSWSELTSWLNPDEAKNMTIEGYRYAIKTTSAVALSLFNNRFEKRNSP